jgi:hypothetical protein
MKLIRYIYLVIILIGCGLPAFCQPGSALNSLANHINDEREHLPVEKLYLQTDKPAYLQEDTIWFKAYLFNADYLTASTRSGLLYVELDDDNNKCLKRIMLPLISGLTWGDIALIKEDIPEGSYTLRAYTNWMRNFGEDYVFKKQLYIASSGEQSRLVSAAFKQSTKAGKNNIRADVLVSDINENPVRLKDMQIKVKDGKHTLVKSTVSTGMDGRMYINFDLPENTNINNLSIQAVDVTKGTVITTPLDIPVILNRAENTDLQFMPEGGSLVAGIACKVGFKAISEDGKGADVSGSIDDSKGKVITTFKSVHGGMGCFNFVPQIGESYTAKIDVPGGIVKSYALPAVMPSGSVLSVSDQGDSLKVSVSFTTDLLAVASSYYLGGQSRGVVCYAAGIANKKTNNIFMVAKGLFPTGIAHFTLLNKVLMPLNERICFIDHDDNLHINISTDKNNYAPHDSIALAIKVTDANGKPVRGSFSLAVTDDSQVKADSLGSTIVNNLLMTSDLKGTVEVPGYYFEHTDCDRTTALDNLMLTQGWVGNDWRQLSAASTMPEYAPESEFSVQGKVTNAFNKPVVNTGVILISKKPGFALDTLTNQDGRFKFTGFSPVDTAAFVLQAKNKHGKNFNAGITVDEFKPPVFTQTFGRMIPWYMNSDTAFLQSLNDKKAKHEAEIKLTGHNVLNEVTIKAKKTIKGSHNLNSDGGADEVLDEKDMEKAGKMTLLDILNQNKEFKNMANTFILNSKAVVMIIDGINIDTFFDYNGPAGGFEIGRYQFLKGYLDYITAEDILGIELLYSFSKKVRYDIKFYPGVYYNLGYTNIAYIEITTRSGNGAYIHTTPGIYEYKPLAFSLPKQFYRPKYTINDKNLLPDLRSTIHWEPNIVTDTAGKANVSFYSADKPSAYTIVMEGSDMNGQVEDIRKKIIVRTGVKTKP